MRNWWLKCLIIYNPELAVQQFVFAFDRYLDNFELSDGNSHWRLPLPMGNAQKIRESATSETMIFLSFFLLKTQRALSSYFVREYKSRSITLIIWHHRLCLWFIDLHFYPHTKTQFFDRKFGPPSDGQELHSAFDLSAIYISFATTSRLSRHISPVNFGKIYGREVTRLAIIASRRDRWLKIQRVENCRIHILWSTLQTEINGPRN